MNWMLLHWVVRNLVVLGDLICLPVLIFALMSGYWNHFAFVAISPKVFLVITALLRWLQSHGHQALQMLWKVALDEVVALLIEGGPTDKLVLLLIKVVAVEALQAIDVRLRPCQHWVPRVHGLEGGCNALLSLLVGRSMRVRRRGHWEFAGCLKWPAIDGLTY